MGKWTAILNAYYLDTLITIMSISANFRNPRPESGKSAPFALTLLQIQGPPAQRSSKWR